ncbi:peptidase C13 family-domain-containing protein [Boletus coccyginus]|nr:peptidase C13 family-domain-containing protein [Boletus coccyginus]
MRLRQLLVCLAVWTVRSVVASEQVVADFYGRHASSSGHTNNWAVLVCASRYWFNYRHMANALGMYRTVKRLGIPDSNIILMLADDVACNTRNKFPGSVYAKAGRHLDLYGDNIEVDYRGYEVTVENFIRLLTGRVNPSVPRSKRLLTDDRSNVFVYMTGHGGNEFLKFQDNEEISAFDIADAFEQMWQKKRYNELLFMIDTCQANTMYSQFYSPNILATGSSEIEENSYSHENDNDIGVSVIDSYTHFVLEFMEGINKTSQVSVQDLFSAYDPAVIRSHAGVRSDLFRRPLDKTRITDFFGGVAQAEVFPPAQESAQTVLLENIRPPETSQPAAIPPDNDLVSLHHNPDGVRDNTLSSLQSESDVWDTRWKDIRNWISLLLVASLVTWVSFA